MRVLLIQPAKAEKTIGGDDYYIFEPLALEYLASGVQDRHQVKILDMRFDKDLEGEILEFNPDVAGLTAYSVHVNTVRDLCRQIKRIKPEILTVVGGHHATVAPDDFFTPDVDLIVMGEGVFVFKEILSRLESRRSWEGMDGIAYRKGAERIVIPPKSLTEIDLLPYPARDLTAKYRKRYFSEWMKPLASLRTSKGCPHRCNFCALWKLTDGKYLRRKPENIVEELSQIKEKHVFFADDESLIDVDRMNRVARLIKEARIRKSYFLYGRSDTIARHPDLIKIWKDIGLERVFIGLEFFRDADLEYINKGSTLENNRAAVEILRAQDVEIYASFIVRPEFSAEDFAEYQKYCREMKLEFASFSVLTPLPGTDYYEAVKDQLITRDFDLYDFFHTVLPTRLSLKEFYRNLKSLYVKAKSPADAVSFVRKYPLKEIPGLIRLYPKLLKRIKNAYRDY